MAEKQFLVFLILFGGQGFDFFGQRADAFYADEKDRCEHLFGVFADGFADDGGQVGLNFFRRPVVFQRVHHAFCRQYTFGEARLLQIFGGAALHGFKYGVADQVVAAVFAVYQEIVCVEMETHLRREIRQPEYGGLQTRQFAR